MMPNIKLINKDLILKKRMKTKKRRYEDIRKKVEEKKFVDLIYQKLGEFEDNYYRNTKIKTRDVGIALGLERKSNSALYSGLRYVLFHEGISVRLEIDESEKDLRDLMFVFARVSNEKLPKYILSKLDSRDLDGWKIRRNNDYLDFRCKIIKDISGSGSGMYILESSGNIFFDRRLIREEQALTFIRHMCNEYNNLPDWIYNTPINIVLGDKFINNHEYGIRAERIGRELRIVRNHSNRIFGVKSIYGKECSVHEYDIDSLIKNCCVCGVMKSFDKAMQVEKLPERINILKSILGNIKIRNKIMVMIDENNKRLVINNSNGVFWISLLDGTMHKVFGDRDGGGEKNKRYICVGPIHDRGGFIIYNGVKYKVDVETGGIISKMVMLLEENYPDEYVYRQIR